ncbi:hypothetical protein GCM10011415_23480 [Salipiger pallidus]|uniref:histidine kinase n=2 Tax=Salipiger pallidus TaxID=1775170 RepID=A0A8J2ZKI9_9RHOB|nr:hypothetical protein GCM10011415_23480 [Salipiger pallidus]
MRLRSLGLALCLASMLTGMAVAALWAVSVQGWDRHLTRAFVAGIGLYDSLRYGMPAPEGLVLTRLDPDEAALADRGGFARLPGMPVPGFVTQVSLIDPGPDMLSGRVLGLGIVSGALQYPVAEIASAPGQAAAQKLGEVTRLMASYCSTPVLFAQLGDGGWVRVDGAPVWGCSVAPRDYRLMAILLGLVALAAVVTLVGDVSARFDRFARSLKDRGRVGGPDVYEAEGPAELHDMVSAVNAYLDAERARLAHRAVVLSGVSHDLGTPATRLRLRAALIADDDLRARFEADIDHMTGMIESVLTLTRSELGAEAPRQVSLGSLVEALVDDYHDTGRPVALLEAPPRVVTGGGSLFSARHGQGEMPPPSHVQVMARPVQLRRALANLVDNALKYGRRAELSLLAGPERVVIVVEDEGSAMSVEEIERLIAPFRRGEGHGPVSGFGLGLSIVATVAEQHGGRLFFERGARGLRACLEIARG